MADVIERAANVAYLVGRLNQKGISVGRTVLQKTAYLVQNAYSVPLGYKFRLHYYGPYSDQLAFDTEVATEVGSLHVRPTEAGYEITATSSVTACPSPPVASYAQKIDEAIAEFGNEIPSKLELYTTIHFADSSARRAGTLLAKAQVVTAVGDLKPRFLQTQVGQAYDRLTKLGLLRSE